MKRYIYILLFCMGVVSMSAQDMKTVFVNMPDSYIPQLESAWRKDLVDLYALGKDARLQNMMNGYSQLLKLTDNYLLLQVTERSTVELKMLPLVNNTHVICMITTLNAPAADSRISFYSTDWELLSSEDMFTPLPAAWFIRDDVDKNDEKYKDAVSRLDMDLMQYRLNPDDLSLIVTYTTPLYLSSSDKDKVMPFLKDTPKIYTWEKYHFK